MPDGLFVDRRHSQRALAAHLDCSLATLLLLAIGSRGAAR